MNMKEKESLDSLNPRERTIAFFYVLILFVLASTSCGFVLFFSNPDYRCLGGKQEALERMSRIRSFERVQSAWMEKISSVESRVAKIDPSLSASYEKREINFLLGEIRNVHVQNKWDERYRIFDHLAMFYELRVFDKERLWTTQKNIEKFNSDLDRCRNSMDKKKIDLMQ